MKYMLATHRNKGYSREPWMSQACSGEHAACNTGEDDMHAGTQCSTPFVKARYVSNPEGIAIERERETWVLSQPGTEQECLQACPPALSLPIHSF